MTTPKHHINTVITRQRVISFNGVATY